MASEPDETEADHTTAEEPYKKASETTSVNIEPEITTGAETSEREIIIASDAESESFETIPISEDVKTEEHGKVSEPSSETDTEADTEPSSVTYPDNEDNNIVPYTPADGYGTSNPFANFQTTEITDTPAEDLIQPGDDRPGEGIHF